MTFNILHDIFIFGHDTSFSSQLWKLLLKCEIESGVENYLTVLVEANLLLVGLKFTSEGPAKCPWADLWCGEFLRASQPNKETRHHGAMNLPSSFFHLSMLQTHFPPG